MDNLFSGKPTEHVIFLLKYNSSLYNILIVLGIIGSLEMIWCVLKDALYINIVLFYIWLVHLKNWFMQWILEPIVYRFQRIYFYFRVHLTLLRIQRVGIKWGRTGWLTQESLSSSEVGEDDIQRATVLRQSFIPMFGCLLIDIHTLRNQYILLHVCVWCLPFPGKGGLKSQCS